MAIVSKQFPILRNFIASDAPNSLDGCLNFVREFKWLIFKQTPVNDFQAQKILISEKFIIT